MIWTIRPYKILDTIGEGLNASVYKISKRQPDLKTDHIFALKVLKKSSDLKIFKLEFESLLKAHGKHLVRYCGWESYKSMPALLLEYIDGVTLYELFKTSDLNETEVLWIYHEILAGLSELADSKLAHGDLSLKNIMIQKDGSLKLIDFGLSHWSTQKIELTPEYAALELINNPKAQPSYSTDLISAQKIVQKISRNFDHRTILTNTSSQATSPPKSLVQKVLIAKEPAAQTKSLSFDSKPRPSSRKIPLIAWSLTSLLFLTPASASNNLRKKAFYQIRSQKWAQVTNQNGETCFTPCSLELKLDAVETLRWKGQKQSGKINIYTNGPEVIAIDF